MDVPITTRAPRLRLLLVFALDHQLPDPQTPDLRLVDGEAPYPAALDQERPDGEHLDTIVPNAAAR